MTTLALINEQTLICENITLDPRPAEEISVPGYIVIDQEKTMYRVWKHDNTLNDWFLVDLEPGQGGIGDKYENGALFNPTKPDPVVQPEASGVQEL